MKKLGKLKLNQLRDASLSNEDMKILVGGERICGCSCDYAYSGGSSSGDNRNANYKLGSDGGDSQSGCNGYYKGSESGTGYDDACDESTGNQEDQHWG